MKVSKLFWEAYRNSIDDSPYDIFQHKFRGIGTTTSKCLKTIAEAMDNPCVPVKVYSDFPNTYQEHIRVFEEVREICIKIGLDWIEFKFATREITYNPYTEIKQKWVEVKHNP